MKAIMPTYAQIAHALKKLKASADPSETQGLMTGVICTGTQMDGKVWLQHLAGKQEEKTKAIQTARAMILELYRISFERLQSEDYDYEILLPPDEELLTTRAEALTAWTQGFLTGLSLGGIDIEKGVSEESQEALYHILEISKLDFEQISVSEQDETAFFEVAEYVRLSAIVIYAEIQTWLDEHSKKVVH